MSSTRRGSERRGGDAYYTPDALARALVSTIDVRDRVVLEPHCGGGAFVRALREAGAHVVARDIDPEAAGLKDAARSSVGDFFAYRPRRVEWVVGNPPYEGFASHIDHALTVAPQVAFLLRLAVMESRERVPCWERWPLRSVHVLAERPSFTGGATDSCAYGWFVFDHDHDGPATVVPGWSWKSSARP